MSEVTRRKDGEALLVAADPRRNAKKVPVD